MKRITTNLVLLLTCISLWAAGSMPVPMPNVGEARLRVCGNNLQNYYVVDLTADRPSYHTIDGLERKTDLIVQSLLWIDADIYALCELEVKDSVLSYLSMAMNEAAGTQVYSFVEDRLSGADNSYIKSGFIYRNDKVRTVGRSSAATDRNYYKNTMRLQTFEEVSTGERFVLSMNHFKAKDSSSDQGEGMRMNNARDLVSALKKVTADPDILVMGDLNCTIEEEPLQYLMTNAAIEEQLVHYDAAAYSYSYRGSKQLIDHALANASMAEQVTGAGVFHINTGTTSSTQYRYSDHDPYIVGLNLGEKKDPDECEGVHLLQDFTKSVEPWVDVCLSGSSYWGSNSTYGAVISGYGKEEKQENWLISPACNLSNMQDVTITINHNIYYHNGDDYTTHQTLWVSTDYVEGNPLDANWEQITIPNYMVKGYTESVCAVPDELLGSNFHYALRYEGSGATQSNYWEVKYTRLDAKCLPSGIDDAPVAPAAKVKKMLSADGMLLIVVDDMIYNAQGVRVQ